MRKIINGKRYNTDTAKRLGNWESDLDPQDFRHEEESLYRTKSGQYFLYCFGGPSSRYGERTGPNSWSSGEKIQPFSVSDARNWAKEHLDGFEYEAIFGEVSEDAEDIQATVRIPAILAEKLTARQDADHCSRNDLILAALREYLK